MPPAYVHVYAEIKRAAADQELTATDPRSSMPRLNNSSCRGFASLPKAASDNRRRTDAGIRHYAPLRLAQLSTGRSRSAFGKHDPPGPRFSFLVGGPWGAGLKRFCVPTA